MVAEIVFRSASHWPWVLPLLALCVTAATVLYARPLATMSRPWRWWLPVLRITALGALCLALLQPTALRPRSAAEQGAIVILLDRSASMDARDIGRSIAQRMRLAHALGRVAPDDSAIVLLRAKRSIERLEALRQQVLRVNDELRYASLSGEGEASATARRRAAVDAYVAQFDELKEMELSGSLRQGVILLSPPSADRAESWVHPLGENIQAARAVVVDEINQLDIRRYQSDPSVRARLDALDQMSRWQLTELAVTTPDDGLLDQLAPQTPVYGFVVGAGARPLALRRGSASVRQLAAPSPFLISDLGASIESALNALHGVPLQSIILFGDGRSTQPVSASDAPSVVSPVPIYIVQAGTDSYDRSLHELSVPPSAFVGERVTIRVVAQATDTRAKSINATVNAGGDVSVHELKLDATGRAELSVAVRFQHGGIQRIAVDLDHDPLEASSDNNHLERWIKVLEDKVRVMVLSDHVSWEVQSLAGALSRTKWIQPRIMLLNQESGVGPSPEEILAQDVLILHQLPQSAMGEAQWNAVHDMVTRGGRSALFVPGSNAAAPNMGQSLLVRELLAFHETRQPIWRAWPGDSAGFHAASLGPSGFPGFAESVPQAPDDGYDWSDLDGFYRYLELPPLEKNAEVLLFERDTGAPLLVERTVGAGRSFVLTFDETWRWRANHLDAPDRFWSQLVRHAAREPFVSQKDGFALDVDHAVADDDASVHLRAKAPSGQAPQNLFVRAQCDGAAPRRVALHPDAANDHYAADLPSLTPGLWSLTLVDGHDRPIAPGVAVPLHIMDPREREMRDLRPDPESLHQLALASGGEVFALDELPDLVHKLKERANATTGVVQRPLWDSIWFYGLVVGCLSLEWALRKRCGLS